MCSEGAAVLSLQHTAFPFNCPVNYVGDFHAIALTYIGCQRGDLVNQPRSFCGSPSCLGHRRRRHCCVGDNFAAWRRPESPGGECEVFVRNQELSFWVAVVRRLGEQVVDPYLEQHGAVVTQEHMTSLVRQLDFGLDVEVALDPWTVGYHFGRRSHAPRAPFNSHWLVITLTERDGGLKTYLRWLIYPKHVYSAARGERTALWQPTPLQSLAANSWAQYADVYTRRPVRLPTRLAWLVDERCLLHDPSPAGRCYRQLRAGGRLCAGDERAALILRQSSTRSDGLQTPTSVHHDGEKKQDEDKLQTVPC